MKRALLLLPLLLAACAPAYSGPKPAPNEVIVEAVSAVGTPSVQLSPEDEAGVNSFAQISVMIIRQDQYTTGLPGSYGWFTFPDGSDGMKILSARQAPIHVTAVWRATSSDGKNTVNVNWESRPLGGRLVSVTAKATATDASVDTRRIEDNLLRRFSISPGIRPLSWGR